MPSDAFWPSRSIPHLSASSCRRLARNDGLPRIWHGAGIYQATELGNLGKSDMCEHASVSCLVFFFFYVYSRILEGLLSFFLFYSNPIFFPHYYSPERAVVHKRGLAGRTAARKHLGQLRPLFFKASLAARGSIRLICNYFLADQFIYVKHQGCFFFFYILFSVTASLVMTPWQVSSIISMRIYV